MAVDSAQTALFTGAFFDELTRWGVRAVVVSPGSRSTPLAMTAYELSRRCPDKLRLFVDVDERGAAFFALGMAKASGRPVAVICTSGTAVANYYPAVMEAESSRVPLIVLTGDRPPHLQGLGAPQTCDQLQAFGDHVRMFRQMPLPAADAASVAFVRQMAREACIHAAGAGPIEPDAASARVSGSCFGGPVHLNFPFDEPLKPDVSREDLFEAGRTVAVPEFYATVQADISESADKVWALLRGRKTLVLAGEGSVHAKDEARRLIEWASANHVPVLADPLSGLRSWNSNCIIDNYDSVFACTDWQVLPEVVIRFGRYPVSKRATSALAGAQPLSVVVDPLETRDFNAATDVFVRCKPCDFMRTLGALDEPCEIQKTFAAEWIASNCAARECIDAVDDVETSFEGAFVRRVVELAPEASCLFAANSMSVRALDTFLPKSNKQLTVLCNRGLNGIDGTVSTALGAAQSFQQTTLITGDLTLLHDLNALALQRELRVQRELAMSQVATETSAPSVVVVLLNNNGGGIFDMLPQCSEDPYFERLFLTPQDVQFEAAAQAFGVPYSEATTVAEFDEAYGAALGVPGISLIEVKVPLSGIKERYAPYWTASS